MRTPESLAIGRLLGWTAMIATLAIMPQFSYDPINLPKLAVISVGGFMALGALVNNRKSFLDPRYRLIQITCLAFILDLFLVLLISGTNTAQEFFGTFGRSTGLVAYLSLCFLLIVGVMAASSQVISRFAWFLLVTGGLSIAYGIIQTLGADPVKWVNQYSVVIGFLGNPNFQSSVVGMSGVLATSMLLDGYKRTITRLGYSSYVAIALFVIKETNSQQGFLVFAGGSMLVILIWISKSRLKTLTIPALVSSAIGLALVTLGSLNMGPLAGFLYKDSVAYRGDYWRAGWEMSLQHPYFGVGLDSYGDWYRRTRSVTATLRRGPEITSNASHNVFIDFSANGGFPLAAIYLLMMLLVVVSAVKLLRRSKTFDPVITGLIAVWIAYQAQSVISLNQLGLAVWGWIISGLIIGYEIQSRVDLPLDPVKKMIKNGRNASEFTKNKVASKTLIGVSVGMLIGLLVGLPPLVSSVKFRSALESGDAVVVEQAAYIWPIEAFHMGEASGLLVGNKFEAQGLKVVTDAVEKFPDRFELWALLAKIPSATAEQKAQALVQMKRLDPNNPNLK
jgi:O-antigen ligase